MRYFWLLLSKYGSVVLSFLLRITFRRTPNLEPGKRVQQRKRPTTRTKKQSR